MGGNESETETTPADKRLKNQGKLSLLSAHVGPCCTQFTDIHTDNFTDCALVLGPKLIRVLVAVVVAVLVMSLFVPTFVLAVVLVPATVIPIVVMVPLMVMLKAPVGTVPVATVVAAF